MIAAFTTGNTNTTTAGAMAIMIDGRTGIASMATGITDTGTAITDMDTMTINEAVSIVNAARRTSPNALPGIVPRDPALREIVPGLIAALSLSLAPLVVAHAAEDRPAESTISQHAKSFGEAVKRDSKAVGSAFKEGAHRVAVAAKAVGHEIATAAKRGAAETRSAFRGDESKTDST